MNSIPFESAETVKNLVGKTLVNNKNGKLTKVISWAGTDFVISDGTKEISCPAMAIVEYIKRGALSVK